MISLVRVIRRNDSTDCSELSRLVPRQGGKGRIDIRTRGRKRVRKRAAVARERVPLYGEVVAR